MSNDVDGDGLGDATALLQDGQTEYLLTFLSTGRRFETLQEPLPATDTPVYLDLDGDDVLESVDPYPVDGGEIAMRTDVYSVADGEYPGVQLLPQYDDQLEALAGDFTGDGADDLLVYGQTERLVLTVWVLAGDGDGGLAAPEAWAVLDGQNVDTTTLFAGDVDDDGVTDLLADRPRGRPSFDPATAVWDGPRGVQVYTSDGESFAPSGGLEILPALRYGDAVVGDFAGDGGTRLVVSDYAAGDGLLLGFQPHARRRRAPPGARRAAPGVARLRAAPADRQRRRRRPRRRPRAHPRQHDRRCRSARGRAIRRRLVRRPRDLGPGAGVPGPEGLRLPVLLEPEPLTGAQPLRRDASSRSSRSRSPRRTTPSSRRFHSSSQRSSARPSRRSSAVAPTVSRG